MGVLERVMGLQGARAAAIADAAERERMWMATRDAIDSLAPEIVQLCTRLQLRRTRLRGLLMPSAWTFAITAQGPPGHASTTMHIGFRPDGSWTLLGYRKGDCRMIVDPTAPFHPGLRQGFVYDAKRRVADVVYKFSPEEIRAAILRQIAHSRRQMF